MLLGSPSLRLAAIYTAVFALAVAGLGATTILATRAALGRAFDERIQAELAAVEADYRNDGLKGLLGEFEERKGTPGDISFGVRTVADRAATGCWRATTSRGCRGWTPASPGASAWLSSG